MTKEEIVKDIKSQGLPVIIAGAGIVGKTLLSVCREEGIHVECFSDNSLKAAQAGFCGLEVIHTSELKRKFQDAVFIISAAAIKDAIDRLREAGFLKWHAGGPLLKDIDAKLLHADSSLDYGNFAVENCILCHDGHLNPDRIFFRSIDLIITERCSLKCKDCSNLMQYYQHPRNCEPATLLKSIDAFCSVIDEVMDFRVIGGETFINKEWHIPTERLLQEPKARRVVLYTNGTIIPDARHLHLLKDRKALVIITDYGPISKRLKELLRLFEENHVAHHVLKIGEWLDCASIEPRKRSAEQSREIFKNCCAKNMATLSDGKLFRCPYAANAFRLQAAPDSPGDYVDLFQEPLSMPGLLKTREKVKNYILNKDYLEICDYCSSRPLSGNEIPPAVQTEKPLPYQKRA